MTTEHDILIGKVRLGGIVTLLASGLNVVVMLAISFGIGPKIQQSIDESLKNREVILESRELVKENTRLAYEENKLLKDRIADMWKANRAMADALKEASRKKE